MKTQRFLSLMLAALMLLTLLAGCGGTTTTPDANPASSDNTDTTPSGDTTDDTAAPADETPAAADELTLPLCDELTTLTAFRYFVNQYISDPGEIKAYIELEKRTNVHIEWSTYSATEQFPLYIAAQNYDDMIFSQGLDTYTGGTDKAIEDECYVDGSPYLSLMPNFSHYLDSSPDIYKQCHTDSGNLFFNNVQSGEQPAFLGPMVRLDWLADCGLDTPVTFDDWHEMLVAFRDQCGADAPLMLSANGYSVMGYGLTPGYNTVGTFYAENGTTVKYGFLDEGMKEYVAMMAQWFSEGLIDKDFMSHTVFANGQSLYCGGNTGAFDEAGYTFRALWPALNADEGNDITAVPFPSKTEAEQGSLHFRRVNEICGTTPIFITTGAVERGVDELCAKWIDYRYSDEGAFIINYGVEGETWTRGEDGLPHFTDFYLNNPDYTSSEMSGLWCDQGYGDYYMWIKEYDMYSADVLSAYDIWDASATGDWVMPPITMTAEEAEDYSSAYGNIETHVNETVLKIIVGDASIDSWDEMVKSIESMGIQDCIAIKQAALDRYNAR